MTNGPVSREAPALLASAVVFAAHGASIRFTEHVNVFGRNVHVDIFEPEAPRNRGRTVLLLHGVGGLLGDGPLMRRAARELAAEGFRAGIVHYFNATGTLFATHANVRDHAADWRSAIVELSRHYAQATGAPLGLFGYSLGGFLAVGAAQEVPGVHAVVVLGGGILEEHETLTPARFPPMLVLHGGSDTKIPPERAEALVAMTRRAEARVECVIYPHEGHVLGTRAERDAFAKAAAFCGAMLDPAHPRR